MIVSLQHATDAASTCVDGVQVKQSTLLLTIEDHLWAWISPVSVRAALRNI